MSDFRLQQKMKNLNKKKKDKKTMRLCDRQFPDCPEEMNASCKPCPYYVKEKDRK